jgi:hypothetical protein
VTKVAQQEWHRHGIPIGMAWQEWHTMYGKKSQRTPNRVGERVRIEGEGLPPHEARPHILQ